MHLPSASNMQQRQRGVYALEWAFIFPVFFLLLYAIICYGLTFLVRESMQFAVEEGARAALRYPIGKSSATWNERRMQSVKAVKESLDWLPAAIKPTNSSIKFNVCRISDTSCNQDSNLNEHLICDVRTPCIVMVSYDIKNYQVNAFAPAIPGLGLILPSRLESRASILVNRRML